MAEPELHREISGSGPPVVLLHGMVGSTRLWQSLINQLPDYQSICLDLLGFGRSPKPRRLEYDLDTHLNAINQALSADLAPFILVGHSMGGLLAIDFALRYPERVKKLILVNLPIYTSVAEAKTIIAKGKILPRFIFWGPIARTTCELVCYLNPRLARYLAVRIADDLPKDVAEDAALHNWTSYSKTLRHVIFEQRPLTLLKQLKIKTVLLIGEDDFLTPQAYRDQLKALPTTIHVHYVKAGHHIPLQHPELITQLVKR